MPVRKKRHKESERFEARVSSGKKSLWQRAARIRGQNLSEFVDRSATEAAERIIREAEFMELTQRDRQRSCRPFCCRPAPPNPKLRQAAERYAQLFPAS